MVTSCRISPAGRGWTGSVAGMAARLLVGLITECIQSWSGSGSSRRPGSVGPHARKAGDSAPGMLGAICPSSRNVRHSRRHPNGLSSAAWIFYDASSHRTPRPANTSQPRPPLPAVPAARNAAATTTSDCVRPADTSAAASRRPATPMPMPTPPSIRSSTRFRRIPGSSGATWTDDTSDDVEARLTGRKRCVDRVEAPATAG